MDPVGQPVKESAGFALSLYSSDSVFKRRNGVPLTDYPCRLLKKDPHLIRIGLPVSPARDQNPAPLRLAAAPKISKALRRASASPAHRFLPGDLPTPSNFIAQTFINEFDSGAMPCLRLMILAELTTLPQRRSKDRPGTSMLPRPLGECRAGRSLFRFCQAYPPQAPPGLAAAGLRQEPKWPSEL